MAIGFCLDAALALAAACAAKAPAALRPGVGLRGGSAAAVIVLAAGFAAQPATGTPDRPSEAFQGANGISGFLHRAGAAEAPSAVVLLVHDSLGMDTRSHRTIAQLAAAGIAVLEIELRANPPDGFPEPLPGAAEASRMVARAASALGADPRFDPARIGASYWPELADLSAAQAAGFLFRVLTGRDPSNGSADDPPSHAAAAAASGGGARR